MYKLVLNENTANGIGVESFSENYSSKYGQRSFSANGVSALGSVSPLDVLQNAVSEGLSLVSIVDSTDEVIWSSNKYKEVENSNISVSPTGTSPDGNHNMSFSVTLSL